MKTGTVIQARTSSTRLPQKVLKELPAGSGIAALQHTIRRLKECKNVDDLIVATSAEKSDTDIARLAQKEGVPCFRGSLDDVLGRYYGAAKEHNLDIVVRITGDCPCIDPDIVDLVIARHKEEEADYTSNTIKRTFPDGLDTEVFGFGVLEKLQERALQADEREHVTLYIRRNLESFKIVDVEAAQEYYGPEMRFTLDTPQDYALLCAVFDALYAQEPYFRAPAIIRLFQKKGWNENTRRHINA